MKYEVVYVSVTADNTLKFRQEFMQADYMPDVGAWVRTDCYKAAREVVGDKNNLLHYLQANAMVVKKYEMNVLDGKEIDASVDTQVCIKKNGIPHCVRYSSGDFITSADKIELGTLLVEGHKYVKYTTVDTTDEKFVQEVYNHILSKTEAYVMRSMQRLDKLNKLKGIREEYATHKVSDV